MLCAPRERAVTGTHRPRAQCLGLARHETPIGQRCEYEPYKARCEVRRVRVSVKTSRISAAVRSSGITLTHRAAVRYVLARCATGPYQALAANTSRIRRAVRKRADVSGCRAGAHVRTVPGPRCTRATTRQRPAHVPAVRAGHTRPAHAAELTTTALADEPYQACVWNAPQAHRKRTANAPQMHRATSTSRTSPSRFASLSRMRAGLCVPREMNRINVCSLARKSNAPAASRLHRDRMSPPHQAYFEIE